MEDQINAVKCRRRHTVKHLLKLKRNFICQTDELINLLKERQHELCFTIDQLCHKNIWLYEEMLYKCWLSAPDFKDDLKFLKDILSKEIDNLSRDALQYDERFEQLNSAIKSVTGIFKSSMVEERVAHEDPKFDQGKSKNKQIFNPSDECTLSSDCSSGSKTSDDSFEVMEITELCEEGTIASEKHENLSMRSPDIPDGMKCSSKVSDWLHKKDSIDKESAIVTSSSNVEEHINKVTKNGSDVSDSMKSSLKVSDWLHKNDSIDTECMIVTSSSNLLEPDNKETKIVSPLQMAEESELVPDAVPVDEKIADFVISNSHSQQVPKSVPFIQLENSAKFLTTKNDLSESSAIRDDFKIWLNDDCKSRGDKAISIQPFNVSKDQSNMVQPRKIRSDKARIYNTDSKEWNRSASTVLFNYTSPAKLVQRSFSSYFVKDNYKEWLCSAKCV